MVVVPWVVSAEFVVLCWGSLVEVNIELRVSGIFVASIKFSVPNKVLENVDSVFKGELLVELTESESV